jgi:hypothetical protein
MSAYTDEHTVEPSTTTVVTSVVVTVGPVR